MFDSSHIFPSLDDKIADATRTIRDRMSNYGSALVEAARTPRLKHPVDDSNGCSPEARSVIESLFRHGRKFSGNTESTCVAAQMQMAVKRGGADIYLALSCSARLQTPFPVNLALQCH
jgi:hypothetical protein